MVTEIINLVLNTYGVTARHKMEPLYNARIALLKGQIHMQVLVTTKQFVVVIGNRKLGTPIHCVCSIGTNQA